MIVGEQSDHERKMVRVRRIETTAKRLERMGLSYARGGARYYVSNGHDRITAPAHKHEAWTDCSGGTIYLAQVADVHLPAGMEMDTFGLAGIGVEGESDYWTMFIKNTPGDEHVINRFRERPRPWHRGIPHYRWWEVGGSDNPHLAGGPSYFIPGKLMGMSIEERVAEFPIHRCFPGL